MKNLKPHYLALFVVLILASCSKDDEVPADKNTSEAKIESFVTPELLTAMKDLGFEVNAGNNPPNVEGTYEVSPMEMTDTSVPNDFSFFFSPLTFTFFNQQEDGNSIEFKGENGNETGKGLGSLIAGDGNKFTVFLKVESTHDAGDTAINIRAISGEISETGIVDFQMGAFMLDNHGNPEENWIPNNTGRVFKDGDAFSPRQETE